MVNRVSVVFAILAPSRMREWKALKGSMAWSAWSDTMIASGSTREITQAAQTRTGPVPRGWGSARKEEGSSSPRAWRRGPKRWPPVRSRLLSSGTRPRARSRVSRIRGCSPASGRSCFGLFGVLTGQNRVPDPPARIVTQRLGSGGIEEFVDSGKEFLGAEWLREEVVGSHPEGRFPVGVLTFRGEDHHGQPFTMR